MSTYRLFGSGSGGNGANGPATATAYSGNFTCGLAFCVTGEAWFQGYWWWVCASGGQPTSAQKFALWQATGSGLNAATPMLVPGSVVTSGTLSPGWNYVPLATPVALSLGGSPGMTPPISGYGTAVYFAATGVNGAFPDTNNTWGSGQIYPNGITNGLLTAYSGNNGGMQYPASLAGNGVATGSQGIFNIGGSDPSLIAGFPGQGTATFDNLWLDVQVADFASTGLSLTSTPLRLWPGMPGANYKANGDNTVSMSGTAFTLSQACKLNKIWVFSSPSSTGFPSRVGIWNSNTQTEVSGTDNASPSFKDPGGGAASAGDGWVYVDYSAGNVILPAGNYIVSFFNGSGVFTYYDSANYFFAGTNPKGGGTVGGAGHAGISVGGGVLTAPNLAGGPSLVYDDASGTFPGQGTYYPNTGGVWRYPGEFEASTDWAETRWADIEVIPVALSGTSLLMASFP